MSITKILLTAGKIKYHRFEDPFGMNITTKFQTEMGQKHKHHDCKQAYKTLWNTKWVQV